MREKKGKRDLFESKPGSKEIPAIELMNSIVSIPAITKLLWREGERERERERVEKKKFSMTKNQ